MFASRPPMGFNTWNTFGGNISAKLIMEVTDAMVEKGYRDAGYKYVVIDDGWMLPERGADGRLVPDPAKFPDGMKALADYVHSRGMLLGIYSCAGVRTCMKLPASYGHEYVDAATFAEWEIDFLKYDFCNFPASGNGKAAYHTMSMALKASGRQILFSACNWGTDEPHKWMRSIGAHMYRSTGDIFDNFESVKNIGLSQIDNLHSNAPGAFNDMDMLVVGMYGNGNVGRGDVMSDEEYRFHFAMWCLFGVPLMIGGDVRKIDGFCRDLLLNPELIALDQDEDCREPYFAGDFPGSQPTFIRHMSDGSFIIGLFNTAEWACDCMVMLPDVGIPACSGVGLQITDVFTGDDLGVKKDYVSAVLQPHSCRLFRARFAK